MHRGSYHHRTVGYHHSGIRRHAHDRTSQHGGTGGSRSRQQYHHLHPRFLHGILLWSHPYHRKTLRHGENGQNRTESEKFLLRQYGGGRHFLARSDNPLLQPPSHRSARGITRAHTPLLHRQPHFGALRGRFQYAETVSRRNRKYQSSDVGDDHGKHRQYLRQLGAHLWCGPLSGNGIIGCRNLYLGKSCTHGCGDGGHHRRHEGIQGISQQYHSKPHQRG